jgi:A/G-specific adenine glycosylase
MAPRIRNLPAVQHALLEWHASRGLHAQWRESGDPYQCLVAAVMAQQTQMSRVLPSYERFIAAFPTIESLAEATPGAVIRVWAGMGYNQRAVRLHRAARQIAASGWPRAAAALVSIDGVGPFTAAIIASFAFGEAAACVDTNVRRVLGRLAGDERIEGAALQRLADASIAVESPARWNQALMDYGATVCAARPKCGECVVARWCASREKFETPSGGGLALRRMVAEERAVWDAALPGESSTGGGAHAPRVRSPRPKRAAKQAQPFEGSARYYRGRIVDLLRALPPGESVALRRLPKLLADGAGAPSGDEARAWARALERQGLVVARGGRISLPE